MDEWKTSSFPFKDVSARFSDRSGPMVSLDTVNKNWGATSFLGVTNSNPETIGGHAALQYVSANRRAPNHAVSGASQARRGGKTEKKVGKATILIHFRCSWLVHVFHTVYVITHTVYQICVYIQYYYTSTISWTLLWRHDTTHQKLVLQSGNGAGCVHSKHLLKRW